MSPVGRRALLDLARRVLEADATADPDDDLRWFRPAAARALVDDVPGAIEAYLRQAALDPFATWINGHVAELRRR